MFKKSIGVVLLFLMILTGCASKTDMNANTFANSTVKQSDSNSSNISSIPFQYAFTGFVSVKDVNNDLPVGVKIFNTQDEWQAFKDKSFQYEDIPLPQYSEGFDFTKESLIYYSVLDAKADFYAQAYQIDKITVENQKLNVNSKDLDGNVKITANSSEKYGGNRYVVLLTIEKRYLQNIQ